VLCYLFPEDCPFSFKQLTVFGQSSGWFTFHSSECQPSRTPNGINLFHVSTLHAYYITFTEARQHLIHLIFDSSLPFTRQVIVLPTGPPRTKRDRVEALSMIGNLFATLISSNTERICIMLFRQPSSLA